VDIYEHLELSDESSSEETSPLGIAAPLNISQHTVDIYEPLELSAESCSGEGTTPPVTAETSNISQCRRSQDATDIYGPLELSDREIRLLHLLPSDDPAAAVQCDLVKDNLHRWPRYKALSYTWGDARNQQRIQVNGRPILVGANLYDCLVHFRQSKDGTELPLWIDALCINQHNIQERNNQVRLMGDIYRSADSVLSWLGSDREVARGIQNVANIAHEWLRVPVTKNGLSPFEFHDLLSLPPEWKWWLYDTKDLWREKDGLDLIDKFLRCEYWKRIWIVQEVILADKTSQKIICGHTSIKATELNLFCICVCNLFGEKNVQDVRLEVWSYLRLSIWSQLSMWKTFMLINLGELKPSLTYVMYTSSTRSSSDPRDTIYGVLAIIADHGIMPDYSKSVREVYIDWAVKTMAQAGNLSLITHAGMRHKAWGHMDFNLPSWVPDLYNTKSYSDITWFESKDKLPSFNTVPVDILDGDVLKAAGLRLDTVQRAETLDRYYPERALIRFCLDYLGANRDTNYACRMPPLQAVIRLVMMSKLPDLSDADLDTTSLAIHEASVSLIKWLIFCIAGSERSWSTEAQASALGLEVGTSFPKSYQDRAFPGIDVGEVFGWRTLADAFQATTRMHAEVEFYATLWAKEATLLETRAGYLGTGSRTMKAGDVVCHISGCDSLLILREAAESGYLLVGPCILVGLTPTAAEKMGGNGALRYGDILLK
jgi:hypothetical protein